MRTSAIILFTISLMTASIALADDNASVELFGGQTLHGTITEQTLSMQTRWGELQLPTATILSLSCQQPPHVLQTMRLQNDDSLVGHVTNASIHLLSDGKPIELPMAQISSIAEPSRAPSPATRPSAQAVVYGLAGDRLTIDPPAAIPFRTRWGLLTFQPNQVKEIVFSVKGQLAQRIVLADGSSLSGMMGTDSLALQPRFLQGSALTILIGEMARLTFDSPSAPPSSPRLDMIGGDVLRGALRGTLTIQTAYGDATAAAADVQKTTIAPDASGDWSVLTNDGHLITGTPRETTVSCQLNCGVSVTLPTVMISAYLRQSP